MSIIVLLLINILLVSSIIQSKIDSKCITKSCILTKRSKVNINTNIIYIKNPKINIETIIYKKKHHHDDHDDDNDITNEPTSSPIDPTDPTLSPTSSPTNKPTSSPNPNPTKPKPTERPEPTSEPKTRKPTSEPSTNEPKTNEPSTDKPFTRSPTSKPFTGEPATHNPTSKPNPTDGPSTRSPTSSPSTNKPTTGEPTFKPSTSSPVTSAPTESPSTAKPTDSPSTARPTESPSSSRPTDSPSTSRPTESPSTSRPTDSPSSSRPTESPSTARPTDSPLTARPTDSPSSSRPTDSPSTARPTDSPSSSRPTESPSSSRPTDSPLTARPTDSPSTARPTDSPSSSRPTESPSSSRPTDSPSTARPTDSPSTARPTDSPSSSRPTDSPISSRPTDSPSTARPTDSPSSSRPTESPSSSRPTDSPSTSRPTDSPSTSRPTESPSSSRPTESPSSSKPTSSPNTSLPTTPAPTNKMPTFDPPIGPTPPVPTPCNVYATKAPGDVILEGLPPMTSRCYAYFAPAGYTWNIFFAKFSEKFNLVKLHFYENVDNLWSSTHVFTYADHPSTVTTLSNQVMVIYENILSPNDQFIVTALEQEATVSQLLESSLFANMQLPSGDVHVLSKDDEIVLSFSSLKSTVTLPPVPKIPTKCNVYFGINSQEVVLTGIPLQASRCYALLAPAGFYWDTIFRRFLSFSTGVKMKIYEGISGEWILRGLYNAKTFPVDTLMFGNQVLVIYENDASPNDEYVINMLELGSDARQFLELETHIHASPTTQAPFIIISTPNITDTPTAVPTTPSPTSNPLDSYKNDDITILFSPRITTLAPSSASGSTGSNSFGSSATGNKGSKIFADSGSGSGLVSTSADQEASLRMKPIEFPLGKSAIIMSVLIFVAAAFAADSRLVEPGLLFYPVLVLIMGLIPQLANPLCQAVILGATTATFFANQLNLRTVDNKEVLDRELIDYQTLLLLLPCLLIGTVGGVLFQVMAPAWFLTTGSVVLLVFGATLAGLEVKGASDDEWIRLSKRDNIEPFHRDENLSQHYLEEEYEAIKEAEATKSIPLLQMGLILCLIVGLALVRGATVSAPSLTGIVLCSTLFYAIFVVQVPLFIIFSIDPAIKLAHNYYIKCQLRLNEQAGEIRWTGVNVFGVMCLSIFVGFCGSVFGFGIGVLLIPLLIAIGAFKQVSYATVSMISIGTTLCAGLNYLVLGLSDPGFQAWCMMLGFTGTFFGYFVSYFLRSYNQKTVRYWVNILIVVALVAILAQAIYLCVVSLLAFVTNHSASNTSIVNFQFADFCTAMKKYY